MSSPLPPLAISSLTNPRVKRVVKLRQRSHRDEQKAMLIEGYRELLRAVENHRRLSEVYYCESLFLGTNEHALLERCRAAGATLFACTAPVFTKMAYRDRPEGLLAVGPSVGVSLAELHVPSNGLVIVAEAIEKPGNLGTILRSADATGVHAVLVCDRCTDINNPNVVRASTGTIFTVPTVECGSAEALSWLRARGFSIVATTPHVEALYADVDLTGPVAVVVGTEQYGLTDRWLEQADLKVRIPMLGQADSLNVASATTILLYEAVRQRMAAGLLREEPQAVPGSPAGFVGQACPFEEH